ncbi:MAG TPA: hypothetical protein VE975_08700 [Actinomycetota bacterium]|nr:hypothetical protein [Actinomycetota bacterium]
MAEVRDRRTVAATTVATDHDSFFLLLPRTRAVLARPAACAATTVFLFVLFAWPFWIHPDRIAPFSDPGRYTWRMEMLLYQGPKEMVTALGPAGIYSGGYRILTMVVGAFLGQLGDVSRAALPIFVMVGERVVLPLALAGLAYKHRKDPLLWHLVALGTGSLMLSDLTRALMDNMLGLVLVTGALYFLEETRTLWRARVAFFFLAWGAGITHPTTLAVAVGSLFVLVAGVALRRSPSVSLAMYGPMLGSLAAGVAATVLSWSAGLWGAPMSFEEVAYPPPESVGYYFERLGEWWGSINLSVTVPLFIAGIWALFAGRDPHQPDALTRTLIAWACPLLAVFGFLAGVVYPYHRFMNATGALLLPVGVGMWAVVWLCSRAGRRGIAMGFLVVAGVMSWNLVTGFTGSHWNDRHFGWMTPTQRVVFEQFGARLQDMAPRPVVVVIDTEGTGQHLISFVRRSGDMVRFGVPGPWLDDVHVVVGSLRGYLMGRPSFTGGRIHDHLARGSLEEAHLAVVRARHAPIILVPKTFNRSGANEELFFHRRMLAAMDSSTAGDVWLIKNGSVADIGSDTPSLRIAKPEPSAWHLVRVVLAVIALFLPGFGLVRWLRPNCEAAEMAGLAPVIGVAATAMWLTLYFALFRAPLGLMAACLLAASLCSLSVVAAIRAARRIPPL